MDSHLFLLLIRGAYLVNSDNCVMCKLHLFYKEEEHHLGKLELQLRTKSW